MLAFRYVRTDLLTLPGSTVNVHPFAMVAIEKRTALQSNALVAELWRDRSGGFSGPTVLGIENPGSLAGSHAVHEDRLTNDEVSRFRAAAHYLGTDPGLLILTAWSILLARYSGKSDLLFGTAMEGRWPQEERRGEPAVSASAVVTIRLTVAPQQRIGDLVRACEQALLGEERHATGALSRTEMRTGPHDGLMPCDKVIRVGSRPHVERRGEVPVELDVTLAEGEMSLRLQHDVARLAESDAIRLLAHMVNTLRSVAEVSAETPVAGVSVLHPDERDEILYAWNATDKPTTTECMHELVEQQAALSPDAVAVVQGAQQLTYRQLNHYADRIAARLQVCGAGPGDFVPVYLERTVHSVAALLGVLKSGAAYVPIDCSLPLARVNQLLASLRASPVICTPSCVGPLLDAVDGLDGVREILWVGEETEAPSEEHTRRAADMGLVLSAAAAADAAPERQRVTAEDIAYMIFTSGSTGAPKGVLLRHAPVVNVIRWVNSTFAVGSADRGLFVTSFGFDLSVYDVFGMLAAGGSIRVATEEEVGDPQLLLSVLDSEPITFWNSAPAALQQLEPLFSLRPASRDSTLRLVFLSGDWIPVSLPDSVRSAFPQAEVVSLGGATEAAIWSNYHRVERVDPSWVSIPYGRPIDNARYYILDQSLSPVPVGVSGDLYIGGGCLAEGYHGDARLTAGKFIPDPFGPEPGGRLYRTGDRARYWTDGSMEFLGRADNQVKLRGFRIEPAEIEGALGAVPGVAAAVAVVRGTGDYVRLIAYAVPRAPQQLDSAALKERLAQTLPAYMVPAEVVIVTSLPVTTNGKVDRKALLSAEWDRDSGANQQEGVPFTPTEKAVAALWEEVLGRPVSPESDFFALGGNSLLAMRVVARAQVTLKSGVNIAALLENPRLRDFARRVEADAVE